MKQKECCETNKEAVNSITIQFQEMSVYDRMHTLSMEYDVPLNTLINVALRRFVQEIDFVRGLREGKFN